MTEENQTMGSLLEELEQLFNKHGLVLKSRPDIEIHKPCSYDIPPHGPSRRIVAEAPYEVSINLQVERTSEIIVSRPEPGLMVSPFDIRIRKSGVS